MHRRSLLGALPAMFVAATASPAEAGQQRLLDLLVDPDAAARIGRAYLATAPAGSGHLRRLGRAIADRIGGLDPAESGERIRARLAIAIRDDFAASRTRIVGGWVLSETECRLCALAARAA